MKYKLEISYKEVFKLADNFEYHGRKTKKVAYEYLGCGRSCYPAKESLFTREQKEFFKDAPRPIIVTCKKEVWPPIFYLQEC